MLHWRGFAVPVKRFRRLNRQKGHWKLCHDVKRCEYEDVRVMWEILSGNVEDATSSPHPGARGSSFCGFRTWVRQVVYVAGPNDHRGPG